MAQHADRFVGAASAVVELRSHGSEFVGVPPDTDPEFQPAVAQCVDSRGLFGDDERIPQWENEDGSADTHGGRVRGDESE